MRIPPAINIVVLILVATGFYTLVGQLVPQKEVPAPEVIEISKDVSTAEMVEIGKGIAHGKGTCLTCHTIGQTGALRFPDLEGIATRAATRIPGMSAVDYMAQSMYEPNAYIVEGFNPGMPTINKPPIQLTDDEILAVIAFLQSLGGTPTVTMNTKHAYNGGGAAEPAPQSSVDAPQEATGPDGKALFDRYGCAVCHTTVPFGKARNRSAILASIFDPDSIAGLSEPDRTKKKQAMEKAGVFDKATVREIELIADYMTEQKAKE